MKRMPVGVLVVALMVSACGGLPALSDEAAEGRELIVSLGCTGCHGETDGMAPSLTGLWGTLRPLVGGSTVLFDGDYVRESITEPGERIVQGYDPRMPGFSLSDGDLDAIVAYLEESR
ncbi:MAG TPA: cytochrome c [Acidimicrobiia bacterium]|nr:cytochrome c [Acidimicrobiia bacterium]